jgi:hypothetical protein
MTDPQTPGLTEEQIAEMERIATVVATSNPMHVAARDVLDLVAEVRRLKNVAACIEDEAIKMRVERNSKSAALEKLAREFCAARVENAKAVDTIRDLSFNANGSAFKCMLQVDAVRKERDAALDRVATLTAERDEARAALARAVEIVGNYFDNHNCAAGGDPRDNTCSDCVAASIFLAEHDRSGK